MTAVVLYFVVFRSYIGIWYAAAVSGLILLFSNIVNKSYNVSTVLLWLDIIVGVMAVIGVFLLLRTTMEKNKLKI
jgi:asparagine N-glycosylation enzyme membrane subunit Stt3